MLLEINDIEKRFGDRQVLDGISFTVDSGEAVALLGSNGAGKTTLLRIINRIIEPDAGEVFFDGRPMDRQALEFIGYLPEERGLYRHMPADRQLVYLARLKGMPRNQAEEAMNQWFERLKVGDWSHRYVNKLSKGMQQKIQFIATVIHSPRLLILDEPFSGFDSDNATMLKQELLRLKSEGTAILLSTHNLQAADEMCDKTIRL